MLSLTLLNSAQEQKHTWTTSVLLKEALNASKSRNTTGISSRARWPSTVPPLRKSSEESSNVLLSHSTNVVFRHLGHSTGSVDSKFHVTAGLWDKDNKRIKSSYGTPPKKGDLHHIYADKAHVDPTYKAHVEKAGKTL